VVGAVVVGGAGAQQAQLVAAVGHQLGLLTGMGGVEAFDAVEPPGVETVDRLEDLVWILDVPERMGPDRHASGVVDDPDRLLHGRLGPGAEAGAALDQVGLEEGRTLGQALGAQALGVGRMAHGGVGQVRAPDRLAGRAPAG